MGKNSYQKILDGELMIVGDVHPSRVAYIEDTEKNRLPKVTLSWVEKTLVYVDSMDEVKAEHKKYFSAGFDGDFSAWATEVGRGGGPKWHHFTLCNFRRYAWNYAPGFNAEHGYGSGITYANNRDAGIMCESPTQLIRETFVSVLAELKTKLPMGFMDSVVLRPIMQRLLEDALGNEDAHEWAGRALGSSNGSLHDIEFVETDRSAEFEDLTWALRSSMSRV